MKKITHKKTKIGFFDFKFFFSISTTFAALTFDSFDNIMIDVLSFRVFNRFNFLFIFLEKRRVFEFFEFFFRRDENFIVISLKYLKIIRDHMNFKQKIVDEINFFDKKNINIAFDVFHI